MNLIKLKFDNPIINEFNILLLSSIMRVYQDFQTKFLNTILS
jgi:hypothetical protein